MTLKTRLESLASAIGADIKSLTTSLGTKEATANKGAASGYAPLDSASRLPLASMQVYFSTKGAVIAGNLDNQSNYTGWCLANNSTTGTPVAGGFYHVEVISYQYNGYTAQIAYDVLSDAVWRRWSNNGVWQPWKRIDNGGKYSNPFNSAGMPGATLGPLALFGQSAGYNYYLPFTIDEPVTIFEARVDVTTASGTAGAKAACSIHAVTDGQITPGTKLIEFPEAAVDSTGRKDCSLGASPVTLQPGKYVMAQRCTNNFTARVLSYQSPKIATMANVLGAAPFRIQWYKAMAYAYPAPNNPTAPDNSNTSSAPGMLSYWVLLFSFPGSN